MPTYVYGCHKCDCTFEKFQPISASPLRKCPKCGHMTLHRLPATGGGLVFKGTGFYETDYKHKSEAPSSPSSSSSGSKAS